MALDGYNAAGNSVTNRAMSRPFLLDPGYYQGAYNYISDETFYFTYGTYCYYKPASGTVFPLGGTTQSNTRFIQAGHTADNDTDIMGVFVANGQLISTPPIGGSSFASGTSYTNPNGSQSNYPTAPTVAPDAVNWQNYNAAQVNPLIDTCGYSFNWVPRSVPIKITKPGIYWLTFSASGGSGDPSHTGDGSGPGIDDVTLTALGSLYMSNPPSTNLTAIPVPDPQPQFALQPWHI